VTAGHAAEDDGGSISVGGEPCSRSSTKSEERRALEAQVQTMLQRVSHLPTSRLHVFLRVGSELLDGLEGPYLGETTMRRCPKAELPPMVVLPERPGAPLNASLPATTMAPYYPEPQDGHRPPAAQPLGNLLPLSALPPSRHPTSRVPSRRPSRDPSPHDSSRHGSPTLLRVPRSSAALPGRPASMPMPPTYSRTSSSRASSSRSSSRSISQPTSQHASPILPRAGADDRATALPPLKGLELPEDDPAPEAGRQPIGTQARRCYRNIGRLRDPPSPPDCDTVA